jgi:glycine/D-amino acid oxidase-like deaminating enzyme
MHEPGGPPPSFWMEEVSEPAAPPWRGEGAVDIAVIGGGYTGLSAAIALRAAGASVVVLERAIAGFGASGRNAGHLTPTIGKDLPTLARFYGRERAQGLVSLIQRAIGHVEATIAQHGIACAYEPVGNVMAAVHDTQHHALDRAAAAAAALGLDGELLEPEAMWRRGLPRKFTRGFLMRRGGILHPGRYVRGLRRVALAAGAVLHEHTPVVHLEDGDPLVLTMPGGRLRAREVVLATNAYTPELGWLRSRVLRLHVYLFATAPLGERHRLKLGWKGREGVYTAHEMLESYRLTDDQRIVGGAKLVRYGYGGKALFDDPETFAAIEDAFRARFPELADVRITHRWGGPIGFSLDFLPAVGRAGKHRNIYYSVGYAGHGVALASYAGTMLTDLIAGREGPGEVLWGRRQVPLPPEPFRWLVVRALTGVMGAMDRRVDRMVGAGAGPEPGAEP